MIRSPRERFLEDKAQAMSHAELCVNQSFVRALDAAMLQYVRDLPNAIDAHSSIVNSARIEGAGAVLKMLLTLADPAPTPGTKVSSNLPGNVREK